MIIVSILAFLIIFSTLVIVHEFGHYYAAIKSGVKVEEFGLGMGKKLLGKKYGETEFTLNLVPFGGFVRMLGEESASKDPRSFGKANLLNRMMITLAGVFMNFILAILLLTMLFTVGTNPILVSKDDINNAYDKGWITFETAEGEKITREALQAEKDEKRKVKIIYETEIQKPLPQAFVFSIKETGRISWAVLKKAGEIPVELIARRALPEGIAGPVGIAEITHKVIPLGFLALVKLAALLSISLGVMNLLPIPALDGGRFMFQLLELIMKPFRRKPSEKLENMVHLAGFVLLMGLLVIITWNDIQRIFLG